MCSSSDDAQAADDVGPGQDATTAEAWAALEEAGIVPENVALRDYVNADADVIVYEKLSDAEILKSWTAVIIAISGVLLPLWIVLARRNSMSKEVLRVGWLPIIAALTASSLGGYILDYAVAKFPPIALHLSTVNALGGNLASVFSCSMSSYLSRFTRMGELPAGEGVCIGPLQMYYGGTHVAHIALILLVAVVPGQTLFVVLSKVLRFGHVSMSFLYYVVYLSATLLQVVALLYMARLVVYALWKHSIDPDNAAIPFLTGCGDFLGTGFLTIGYEILARAKDDTEDLEQELQALRASRSHSASTPATAWDHLNKTSLHFA
ncbi:solute carrier family 41 member 1-like [Haemaphysalis longicornis]